MASRVAITSVSGLPGSFVTRSPAVTPPVAPSAPRMVRSCWPALAVATMPPLAPSSAIAWTIDVWASSPGDIGLFMASAKRCSRSLWLADSSALMRAQVARSNARLSPELMPLMRMPLSENRTSDRTSPVEAKGNGPPRPPSGRYHTTLATAATAVAVRPESMPPYSAARTIAGSSRMKSLRPSRIPSSGIRATTATAIAPMPTASCPATPAARVGGWRRSENGERKGLILDVCCT